MHRVLHVLRAPVGGLFRHVRDLVAAQHGMGLVVGMVCDSTAADRLTEERLAALQPHLALGLHTIPISRSIGLGDTAAFNRVLAIAESCAAGILHGHGAKGGAFARMVAARQRQRGHRVASFYTPHGGSLNFKPTTLKGRVYMAAERRLEPLTSGLIFESAWSEQIYRRQVCDPTCAVRVIPNGLLPSDFAPHRTDAGASDIVFVGELRPVKGVDVLLEAIAAMRVENTVRAELVGDGPDAGILRARATALGLSRCVRFQGALPVRKAFGLGRVLAIPSRTESLPYIVLEAAAAGIPLITTNVGGIPEIVAGSDTALIPPDDVPALAAALMDAVAQPAAAIARASRLREAVRARFTVERMAREIVAFYDEVAGPATAEKRAPLSMA